MLTTLITMVLSLALFGAFARAADRRPVAVRRNDRR